MFLVDSNNLTCSSPFLTMMLHPPSLDPHRGNLLKTPDRKLAFIDYGMMADIDEDDRYGK